VRPRPTVHPDLAALIALAVANEQSTSVGIEVRFVERECLADPQPGAPEDDDHAAQPDALGTSTRRAHHSDDLLDCWRVGWISKASVARRNAVVERRCRRR
jgi:hypothetical protein